MTDTLTIATADFTLRSSWGFYELTPHTSAARKLVKKVKDAKLSDIGTDDSGENILLSAFFADAATWCAVHVLPEMSLQWGDDIYVGDSGKEALWELGA